MRDYLISSLPQLIFLHFYIPWCFQKVFNQINSCYLLINLQNPFHYQLQLYMENYPSCFINSYSFLLISMLKYNFNSLLLSLLVVHLVFEALLFFAKILHCFFLFPALCILPTFFIFYFLSFHENIMIFRAFFRFQNQLYLLIDIAIWNS